MISCSTPCLKKNKRQSIFQKAEQHTVRLPRRQKHIVRSRAEPASLLVFEDHPSLKQQSLTTAALSCSKCPFSLESTVVPNHLCGRSAYGFCSCSSLNILLGCISVLMQLPVQKLRKKKFYSGCFRCLNQEKWKLKQQERHNFCLDLKSKYEISCSSAGPNPWHQHSRKGVASIPRYKRPFCVKMLSVSMWVLLVPPG